jgi:hypothetical protein
MLRYIPKRLRVRFTGAVSLGNPKIVLALFAGMIVLQALGFLIWGTGRTGRESPGYFLFCKKFLTLDTLCRLAMSPGLDFVQIEEMFLVSRRFPIMRTLFAVYPRP